MTAATPLPHHLRCGPDDLVALARVWEWEETVSRSLGDVIDGGALAVSFQGVYRIDSESPVVGGQEAVARFPCASRIPAQLWFRVASENGRRVDLEVATARKALETSGLPEGLFLSLNSTPSSLGLVLAELERHGGEHVVEIGYMFTHDARTPGLREAARQMGVRVAIDDVPLADFDRARATVDRIRPDMVKLDLLEGLDNGETTLSHVTSAVGWCETEGIDVVAERVQSLDDIAVLAAAGVSWAQGDGIDRAMGLVPR